MMVKVIQGLRYVHSCLELAILITMSTSNLSQKSVVLEYSAKPSFGSQSHRLGLVWLKFLEPLALDKSTLEELCDKYL